MKIIFYNDLKITFDHFSRIRLYQAELKVKNPDVFQFADNLLSDHYISDVAVLSDDPQDLFSDFCKYFKRVVAAGGLVRHSDGNYLFIKRWERWDLPKGKAEHGELPHETALREVEEETGVKGLSIVSALPDTWHIYKENHENMLKRTYWFLMSAEGRSSLRPQTNEQITEAVWFTPRKSRETLSSSYRSLSETLSPYLV